MSTIYRVREAFHYTDAKGVPQFAHTDLLVSGDDPIVAKWPQFVEPVEVAAARAAGTETADAAPGSVRTRGKILGGRKPEPTPEPKPEVPETPAEKE